MVDGKYSTDTYKSILISIGTIIRNSEILNLFLIILKLKKICKHAVKKLPYLLRYVPDQHKTQQVCS